MLIKATAVLLWGQIPKAGVVQLMFMMKLHEKATKTVNLTAEPICVQQLVMINYGNNGNTVAVYELITKNDYVWFIAVLKLRCGCQGKGLVRY